MSELLSSSYDQSKLILGFLHATMGNLMTLLIDTGSGSTSPPGSARRNVTRSALNEVYLSSAFTLQPVEGVARSMPRWKHLTAGFAIFL